MAATTSLTSFATAARWLVRLRQRASTAAVPQLCHVTRLGTATTHSTALEDESVFHRVADRTIHALQERVEAIVDDHCDGGDVTYGDGVLTVFLGHDEGTFVLNKQTPNRQLWLSSPVSGPFRYDYGGTTGDAEADDDELDTLGNLWVSQRDGHKLIHKLREEFAQLLPSAQPL